jgi:SAM-dependent methyltransferase
MSQKTKKIYSLLSNTHVYSLVQKIMSGTSFREKIVKTYIKKKNVKVLDIGCGPAEILNCLPQVDYFGYDISPIYINYAKKKYKNRGKFFCKKFTNKEVKKLPKFDHILLLGILHHLNDLEVKRLMQLLKKVLKRNGNIITEDPIFVQKQNSVAEFIIKMDRGDNVRRKNGYTELVEKYFNKVKSKIYHQKFIPYTWFVMSCKN